MAERKEGTWPVTGAARPAAGCEGQAVVDVGSAAVVAAVHDEVAGFVTLIAGDVMAVVLHAEEVINLNVVVDIEWY